MSRSMDKNTTNHAEQQLAALNVHLKDKKWFNGKCPNAVICVAVHKDHSSKRMVTSDDHKSTEIDTKIIILIVFSVMVRKVFFRNGKCNTLNNKLRLKCKPLKVFYNSFKGTNVSYLVFV